MQRGDGDELRERKRNVQGISDLTEPSRTAKRLATCGVTVPVFLVSCVCQIGYLEVCLDVLHGLNVEDQKSTGSMMR